MRRFKWLILLAIQAAVALFLSYLVTKLHLVSPEAYEVGVWVFLPALGALSAYLATTHGLNNYAAWLMPPAMGVLGTFLASFLPPDTSGPVFVCALLSIIGAATGEVVLKRRGE